MQAVTLQNRPQLQSRISGRRQVQVSAYLTSSAPPPTIQARPNLHDDASFRDAVQPKGGVEHLHLGFCRRLLGKLAAPRALLLNALNLHLSSQAAVAAGTRRARSAALVPAFPHQSTSNARGTQCSPLGHLTVLCLVTSA